LGAAALMNTFLVLFAWSESSAEHLQQAADLADRAVAIDPKNITVLQATAFVLCAQGRATEAVPILERTLEETPNNAGSYSNMAFALLHAGKEQRAIDLLRKAIRLSPQDPFIDLFYLNLGLANLRLGHINEAIEWLQRSVNRNPSLDFAYLMLASAYALCDRMGEARAATAKALALANDWTVTKLKAASPSWLSAVDQGLRKAGLPH
jgi:adenylate cyclase